MDGRKTSLRISLACAAAFGLLQAGAASAEPASADPAYFAPDGRPARARAERGLGVAPAVFISAHGRSARLDTLEARDALSDARAMGQFMAGYPQPPVVTFDIEVRF
jgi:hypothetical protein